MVAVMELYQMRLRVEDALRAFQSLDRELAKITLTPGDAASVEAAMRQMQAAVDRKAAPFRGNPFVEPYIKPLKDKYRAAILAKAAGAKASGEARRAHCFWIAPACVVIASDSEAIQAKRQPQSLSLDCFALLAMTTDTIRLQCIMLRPIPTP